MSTSLWSGVVEFTMSGGIIVPPEPEPFAPVQVVAQPLVGGFIVRLTPDARGWTTSYSITAVFVRYCTEGSTNSWVTKQVAAFHPRQNLPVQKTFLGLPKNQTYEIQCYGTTEDETGPIFFAPAIVTTLPQGAPVTWPEE